MPPAARITDMHTCPMVNPGPVPHVGGPDISGSPDVIVGFMPQARVGDTLICVPAIDKISKGSPTVLVNNKQAARLGDPTQHGGVLVTGCPTVIIGESGQGAALSGAAKTGAPFCEECEKAKQAAEEAALQAPPPPNSPPADSVTAPPDEVIAEGQPRVLQADPGTIEGRRALAQQFFENGGQRSPERAASFVKGVDLTRPLDIVELGPANEVIQYTEGDRVGKYFAPPGTPANTLGISGADRLAAQRFRPPDGGVRALRSTAADLDEFVDAKGRVVPGGPGGGIQYQVADSSGFTRVP
jgi:uncharacterized Zn-binding protein involved in type VI secretion